MLSRLTGRRSLAGMVEVLRPAAAWLRDGPDAHDDDRALFQDFLDWTKVLLPQLEMPVRPDHAATLEWRELMDELTVIEARAREWPQEWLDEGRAEGRAEGIQEGRAEGRAKGIQEGRAEGIEVGIERGQRALLCHQAARRFGATAGERPGRGPGGHTRSVASARGGRSGPRLRHRNRTARGTQRQARLARRRSPAFVHHGRPHTRPPGRAVAPTRVLVTRDSFAKTAHRQTATAAFRFRRARAGHRIAILRRRFDGALVVRGSGPATPAGWREGECLTPGRAFVRHINGECLTPGPGGRPLPPAARAFYLSTMDAAQLKDKVCKRLFRHRTLVADLLRGYVPGRWVRGIDFATLRQMPAEYVGRGGLGRFGDGLWLARLRDGRQVMAMVEVQSGAGPGHGGADGGLRGHGLREPDAPPPGDRAGAIRRCCRWSSTRGRARWTAAAALRDLVDPVGGPRGLRRRARLPAA